MLLAVGHPLEFLLSYYLIRACCHCVLCRHLQADLLDQGSFDAAVAGCRAVIHVASPVNPRVPPGKGREVLIEPAVKGVENVLGAVERTPSVQVVVMTSSVAGWSPAI
jgi:nucleoside-diphosphate-sugar epimerase